MSDPSLATPLPSLDVSCSSVEVAPVALFPAEFTVSSASSDSSVVLPSSNANSTQAPKRVTSRNSEGIVSINLDTKLYTIEPQCSHADALVWVNQVSHPRFSGFSFEDYISAKGKIWVDMKMSSSTTLPRDDSGDVPWRTFSTELFCASLLAVLSDSSTGLVIDKSLIEKVKAFTIKFDLQNSTTEEETCYSLRLLASEYPFSTTEEQAECFALLMKKLPEKWKVLYLTHPSILSDKNLVLRSTNIHDFTIGLLQMCKVGRSFFRVAEQFGASITYSAHTRCTSNDGSRIQKRDVAQSESLNSSKEPAPKKGAPGPCYGCGVVGHYPRDCNLRSHADYNKERMPWSESPKGIQWKAKGQDTLPPKKTLEWVPRHQSGTSTSSSSSSSSAPSRPALPWSQRKGMIEDSLSSLTSLSQNNLLLCHVSLSSQRSTTESDQVIETLLDTGALAGNFIAEASVIKLNLQ